MLLVWFDMKFYYHYISIYGLLRLALSDTLLLSIILGICKVYILHNKGGTNPSDLADIDYISVY